MAAGAGVAAVVAAVVAAGMVVTVVAALATIELSIEPPTAPSNTAPPTIPAMPNLLLLFIFFHPFLLSASIYMKTNDTMSQQSKDGLMVSGNSQRAVYLVAAS